MAPDRAQGGNGDIDVAETKEWLDALGGVLQTEGPARASYLLTQLKFIMLLWLFIGTVIFVYFAFLAKYEPPKPVKPSAIAAAPKPAKPPVIAAGPASAKPSSEAVPSSAKPPVVAAARSTSGKIKRVGSRRAA